MAKDLEKLKDWIGERETDVDYVTIPAVHRLAATLDRDDPVPKFGDPLPAGWQVMLFPRVVRQSQVGHDGHPTRGDFLPPVPLPRRMWAGGRIEFLAPLRIGDTIRRDSEILSVEPKHGRSGDLVFVTVRHTISTGTTAAVREEHDIVYRDAAKAGDAPLPGKPAPQSAVWQRSLTGDPVMLFRYSALTFNGHRIHYDLDYVKNEEHYPGLIVHGPLQTTLLLDLCRRHAARPLKKLDYRALHPVFHGERFTVNGNPAADGSSAELWTANAAGNLAMAGTAYF